MTVKAIIGPEHYDDLNYQVWQWVATAGGQGIATIGGEKWYEIDAVNGATTGEYGYWRSLTGSPTHLLLPFQFYLPSVGGQGFDTGVSILELSTGLSGTLSRRLRITNADKFQIVDKNEASVGIMASGISLDTVYNCLYLVNVGGTTRDALWITSGASYGSAVIDVTGHGNAEPTAHANLYIGSGYGKTLPTSGGPFYTRQGACFDLGAAPNNAPLGSVKVVAKMPDGNGADTSFNDGPTFGDVDEIPYSDADHDSATAVNQRASYTLPAVDGGDVPLAVQPIGARKRSVGSSLLQTRPYLLHSGTRDYGPLFAVTGSYRGIGKNDDDAIWNQINGLAWSAARFAATEIGLEVTTLTAGDELRLAQLGVEYVAEGDIPLPDDYSISAGDAFTERGIGRGVLQGAGRGV